MLRIVDLEMVSAKYEEEIDELKKKIAKLEKPVVKKKKKRQQRKQLKNRGKISDMSYLSNQKLWKIVKEPTGYYYEIKLAGVVIDRLPVEYPALGTLKKEGVI